MVGEVFGVEVRRRFLTFMRDRLGLASLLVVAASVAVAASSSIIARFAPPAAPQPVVGYGQPSRQHILGTNPYGEDIFFTLLGSFAGSLFTCLIAASISVMLALAVGVMATRSKRANRALKEFLSIFLLLPAAPLMVFLVAGVQISPFANALVIALVVWPTLTGLVTSTLAMSSEIGGWRSGHDRSVGGLNVSARRALASTFITAFTLASAGALLADAGLGFLGLTDPRVDSWGRMLNEAFREDAVLAGAWWAIVPVGLVVTALSLSFVAVGHVLERDLWRQMSDGGH